VIAREIPIGAVMAIVLIAGVTAAWVYRHSVMKASLPIVTFALVLALGIGVTTHDRAQSDQGVRDAKRAVEVKAHDDCVARVERSIGNRSMWLDLANVLEQSGRNPQGAVLLRTLLDKNLPSLTLDQCPEAPQ
jgi:hypothetical protein